MSQARLVHFIPGAAGLGAFWEPIAAALPEPWVARIFDLPGYGQCAARADIRSHLELVEYVAGSIQTPGVVVGQSMGGYVALELALRHPELVTELVLVVAAGGVDMARHGALDWRISYSTAHPASPSWVVAPLPDLTPELRRIQVPVLLLWASRDPISPLGVAEHLREHLPDARLQVFDTDDHWVARQFAVPVGQALDEFVTASRAGRGVAPGR
jgi:2-hydroxy-6-oxonona-2,4-dienedioate hydrolase